MRTVKSQIIFGVVIIYAIVFFMLLWRMITASMVVSVGGTTKIISLPDDIGPLYARKLVKMDHPDVMCMAENIYHEARDQGTEGMRAVGFVTMNRVNHIHYPNSVCGVVHESMQFSWTNDDTLMVDRSNPIELEAWHSSVMTAYEVINDIVYNDFYGITHYHADYVDPEWSHDKTRVKIINSHIYYVSSRF